MRKLSKAVALLLALAVFFGLLDTQVTPTVAAGVPVIRQTRPISNPVVVVHPPRPVSKPVVVAHLPRPVSNPALAPLERSTRVEAVPVSRPSRPGGGVWVVQPPAEPRGKAVSQPGSAAVISLSCDKKQVVVGQSAVISGSVVDVYGNPVEDDTVVSVSASAGMVSQASTVGGAFSVNFTAPTKKQVVTVTARAGQAEASLEIPVVADVPAKVTVSPEKEKAMVGTPVPVEILVEDRYGNPVEDGTLVSVAADGGSVDPVVATTRNGTATVQLTSDRSGVATVRASAENGIVGSASVTFAVLAPPGSQVEFSVAPRSQPSEYDVRGQVKKDGIPVPFVAVPLVAQGGDLSDPVPVADQQGEFGVVLKKTDASVCASVAIDTSQAPGVAAAAVGIDPLIYGNQPWTDTGIDVDTGQLVRVDAQGFWASELYAMVGENGTPVKVGADGGFVTGVAGRLYLGPNTATYADDVDAIIHVNDPAALGILPTLNLTASPAQLPADGKSTSTISGRLMYARYPAVGAAVSLSAELGSINPSVPITGADGSYRATFTASVQDGTAIVTGTYKNLTQRTNITLIPVGDTVGNVLVTASPQQALADGKTAITVTAEVKDIAGRPVPDGTVVVFSTTLGSLSAFSAVTSGGAATILLVSSVPGTATVTVVSGGAQGSVTVSFSAYKGTLYVGAAAGSDDIGDGSREKPFRTFMKAYSVAQDGWAIKLGPGTYYFTQNYFAKSVDVIGEEADTVLVFNPPYTRFEDVTSYGYLMFASPKASFYKLVIETRGSNTYANYFFAKGDISFWNVGFRNFYDIDYADFFNVGGKFGFYNCAFAKSASVNYAFRQLRVVPDTYIVENTYGLLNVFGSSAYITFVTNLKSSDPQVDADFNILEVGWQHAGTGTNPDGTQAHIGVYGGPYAWRSGVYSVYCHRPRA